MGDPRSSDGRQTGVCCAGGVGGLGVPTAAAFRGCCLAENQHQNEGWRALGSGLRRTSGGGTSCALRYTQNHKVETVAYAA